MDQKSGAEGRALHGVVVANLHKRFTGVSRTISELVPHQRKRRDITVLDTGALKLGGGLSFWSILWRGWARPKQGKFRVFHARRDVEMMAGLVLRAIPGQKWKVMFTSAAPKAPNGFLQVLINRMDAVVATSARSAGFLPWHTSIIGHGVDTDAFQPAQDKPAMLREVGLDGQCVIGVFGRVRPSKGTDLVVEALLKILPNHRDVTCVMSGLTQDRDRAFVEEMKKAIVAAGLQDRILFLGDQSDSDIKRWYQRISICVAASRTEGYGLTPFEAFASGATAVTSHAGVWPQVITPDIGVLFETGDGDGLAGALGTLLNDRRMIAEMGQRARRAAETKFSITTEVSGLETIYEQLQRGDILPRTKG